MTDDRERILAAMRHSLGRAADDGAAAAVDERLARHGRNTVPARTALDRNGLLDLFVRKAEAVSATVDRVASADDVPEAIARYLKERNLPAAVKRAPEALLDRLPWERTPMLEVAVGAPDGSEATGVTGAFAAVAETGTLAFASGPGHPSTLAFLPETHIVVLEADRVVGPYEDVWDRLRADGGPAAMPRTLNLVTGPSRTGDIEQTILLGAHGPRRLHIVLVEDGTADAD
jgi:L-lactate dehydrogenase complex protein LldG